MNNPFDIAASARRMMVELCDLVCHQHPDLAFCSARVDSNRVIEREATLHMHVRWVGSPIEHTLSWVLEPEDQLDTLLSKISQDIATARDLADLPLVEIERSSEQILSALEHLISYTDRATQPTIFALLHKMLPHARQLKGAVVQSFWDSKPFEASIA